MRFRSVVLALALTLPLIVAANAAAAPTFTRVSSIGVTAAPNYGMVRTPDGVLHLVFQTSSGGAQPDGLATRAISPAGVLGQQVPALSGWNTTRPGLVRLPNGTLEAVFGALSPNNQPGGVWGIGSSDGGATWSAPAVVGTGDSNEALAYGSDMTAQLAGGTTPVITMAPAGNLVVQQGLGQGSSTAVVTDNTDNSAGDVDSTVDAGSGQVFASWQSNAGSGGDFIQPVAPSIGSRQTMPGPIRNEIVISGRDKGAGIFAAYTLAGSKVQLQRFGGGSVSVGQAKGITPTKWGTATSLDGRIWVMWGSDAGVAVTRSNMAVTKFEPVQKLKPDTAGLLRLGGDGRLGPLDLLVDQIPNGSPIPPGGTFYARVLPELSASVKVTTVKKTGAHKLKVTVTDAGDPVAGAKVAGGGKKATTNAKGVATLTVKSKAKKLALTITHSGYNKLKQTVKL